MYVWWKEKKTVFLYKEKKKDFLWELTYKKTDWETILLGHHVELRWRLKVFSSLGFEFHCIKVRFLFFILNSRLHVIFYEWSKSVFVTSAMCFVWDTKPDFPTISGLQYYACITCDWVLELNKTVFLVFWKFSAVNFLHCCWRRGLTWIHVGFY